MSAATISSSSVEPVSASKSTAPALARAGSPRLELAHRAQQGREPRADLLLVAASSRSANSSPPKRARNSFGPRARRAARRDRPQQRVAGGVAERVVDVLEVVDVDERDRSGRAGGAAARELVAEPAPVGEPGELVVVGRGGGAPPRPARRSVMSVSTPSTRTGRGRRRRAAERALVADPDGAPVAGDHPVLDRERLERLRAAGLLERRPARDRRGASRLHQKSLLTSHSSAGKPSRRSICGET